MALDNLARNSGRAVIRRSQRARTLLVQLLGLVILTATVIPMTHAQTPTPAELKQRKEAAEAEKLTLDAEIALEESRKKL